MKTWQKEALIMFLIQGITLYVNAGVKDLGWSDFFSFFGVFFGFCHGQVADRLREYAEGKEEVPPACMQKEKVYFLLKEAMWFGFFLSILNFTSLMGTLAFLLYPKWRAYYRKSQESVKPAEQA